MNPDSVWLATNRLSGSADLFAETRTNARGGKCRELYTRITYSRGYQASLIQALVVSLLEPHLNAEPGLLDGTCTLILLWRVTSDWLAG
jgi:hypothetical protein